MTRRMVLAGLLVPLVGGCAWLTGTRRRGRRRGRRRARRREDELTPKPPTSTPTSTPAPSSMMPSYEVEGSEPLVVGDVLWLEEGVELDVMAVSADGKHALLLDASNTESWAQITTI